MNVVDWKLLRIEKWSFKPKKDQETKDQRNIGAENKLSQRRKEQMSVREKLCQNFVFSFCFVYLLFCRLHVLSDDCGFFITSFEDLRRVFKGLSFREIELSNVNGLEITISNLYALFIFYYLQVVFTNRTYQKSNALKDCQNSCSSFLLWISE